MAGQRSAPRLGTRPEQESAPDKKKGADIAADPLSPRRSGCDRPAEAAPSSPARFRRQAMSVTAGGQAIALRSPGAVGTSSEDIVRHAPRRPLLRLAPIPKDNPHLGAGGICPKTHARFAASHRRSSCPVPPIRRGGSKTARQYPWPDTSYRLPRLSSPATRAASSRQTRYKSLALRRFPAAPPSSCR